MENKEFLAINAIDENFEQIDKIISTLRSDTKRVICGNDSDKYDAAKEITLDGGAAIMSLLGEIIKKIDEISGKSEKNS